MRERKEDLAKQELAQAISRRSDTEADLRTIDAHLEQTRDEQRTATAESSTVGADELIARQAFLEHVEAKQGEGLTELQRHEAEVSARDVELTRAAGEHEMLKRLENRQRSEHEREVARHESNALDEIALSRFSRSVA